MFQERSEHSYRFLLYNRLASTTGMWYHTRIAHRSMCVSMYSLEHVQSHVETVPYVSVHIMYGPVLLEYVAPPPAPCPPRP